MMKLIRLSVLVLAAALFQRAEAAPFTNYLDGASNLIAQSFDASAGTPKVHAILGRALNDFKKPSTSVAGDYKIFVAVATHLLPLSALGGNADLGLAMTNAYQSFVLEALTEAYVLSNRVAMLSQFQPQRRPASNAVFQAEKALQTALTTSNLTVAFLSVRLAFVKLTVAAKLEASAEAHPGLAPDSVAGRVLTHNEGSRNGTVTFTDDTNFTETDNSGSGPSSGTYTWTRTGLNTATLVLTSGGTTTVKARFTTTTNGTFSYHHEGGGDQTRNGTGTFTLQ